MTVEYELATPAEVDVEEVARVYAESGLGDRRPVDDTPRFTAMVRGCNLLVLAREQGRAVGVARCLTDDSYVTYVSDLAVSKSHQHLGIGRRLLDEIEGHAPGVKIVLLAAPEAQDYYPKVGFTPHHSAWVRSPTDLWKHP